LGAAAEAGVARLFGGVWDGAVGRGHYGGHDVRTRCDDILEVKATHYRTGKVLVYNDTPDDAVVVFAVVAYERREVRVVGYLRARDAKQQQWWRADFRTPCYAAPQSALTPIEEFPCLRSSPAPSASPPPSS
jgi:hypothetical protein